jgi:NADH-quinone oxidoreductase subunit M
MVITFASVALPLTNGFIGEFLLLSSLYDYSYVFAAFAGLTVIFGAVYMLRAYKTSMLGENPAITVFADLTISEKLVLFPIVGLIVFFGLFPQFIFNLTDESVKYLLTEISNHMVPNL